MDMGFSVKRSGNFLPWDLSMKKDSPCLESFSSEQCFAKVLPHPFFLRVHILGYSIIQYRTDSLIAVSSALPLLRLSLTLATKTL